MDQRRARPRQADRLAARVARRAFDRDRRGVVRRSRRERPARPLGLARHPRTRRRTRRRQGARPRRHAPEADDVRRRHGARARRGPSRRRGRGCRLSFPCGWHGCGGGDGGADLAGALANCANDSDRAPRHRSCDGRRRNGHDGAWPGAGAAHRAFDRAYVRIAQRHRVRVHDPVRRREHLDAAGSRHRSDHRRPQRLRRRLRAGDRGVARLAQRHRRRGERRPVFRRLEQSHDSPHRRPELGHRTGRRQSRHGRRVLGRQRPGNRGAARHPRRRGDRTGRRHHRGRFAQRPHPPGRSADRRHHHHRRFG